MLHLISWQEESKCHRSQPQEPHKEINLPPELPASGGLPEAGRQAGSGPLTWTWPRLRLRSPVQRRCDLRLVTASPRDLFPHQNQSVCSSGAPLSPENNQTQGSDQTVTSRLGGEQNISSFHLPWTPTQQPPTMPFR